MLEGLNPLLFVRLSEHCTIELYLVSRHLLELVNTARVRRDLFKF